MADEIAQKALNGLSHHINLYFFRLGQSLEPGQEMWRESTRFLLARLKNKIAEARIQFDSPLPEEDVFAYGISEAISCISEAKASKNKLDAFVAAGVERSLCTILMHSNNSFSGLLDIAENAYNPANSASSKS